MRRETTQRCASCACPNFQLDARRRLPAHTTTSALHARGGRHLLTRHEHFQLAPWARFVRVARPCMLYQLLTSRHFTLLQDSSRGPQSVYARHSATYIYMHLCSKNGENRRRIAQDARVRILLRGGPPSAARALKMRPHGARATRTGQAPIFGTSRLHYRGAACASLRAPLGRSKPPSTLT